MSDPTPSTQTVQINLADMARRYTGSIQRTFDLAAATFGALRTQTEKDYDELSRSLRFMPAPQQHATYDTIRPIAEMWLMRQILSDALGLLVPFLEDARSVTALAEWKASGSTDQATLQKILGEDRQAFLRLSLPEKLKHLKDRFSLSAQNEGALAGFLKLGQCLTRGGTVTDADVTEGNELVVMLTAVQLLPSEQGQQQSGRLVEAPKRFAIGQRVEFRREEALSLLTTISVFVTALMGSLHASVQKLLPGEAKPA